MQNFSSAFILIIVLSTLCLLSGCKDDDTTNGPFLIFTFKFDETQVRLDNFGQPATIPAGNAAQSPTFQKISAHYVELAPDSLTLLGQGAIVYEGPETTAGGAEAVDFAQAIVVGEDEVFLQIPLSQVTPNTYDWLRVSLTYQNYDILFSALGFDLSGRVSSFVGFNTYITDHTIKDSVISVNANKLQGYGAFETNTIVSEWQTAAGATTVPNPIAATSPVPAGSCVVTGRFANGLTITGTETQDVNVVISLTVNNSFEWVDTDSDGKYDPLDGEQVVDMGLRGLVPIVQ